MTKKCFKASKNREIYGFESQAVLAASTIGSSHVVVDNPQAGKKYLVHIKCTPKSHPHTNLCQGAIWLTVLRYSPMKKRWAMSDVWHLKHDVSVARRGVSLRICSSHPDREVMWHTRHRCCTQSDAWGLPEVISVSTAEILEVWDWRIFAPSSTNASAFVDWIGPDWVSVILVFPYWLPYIIKVFSPLQ